MNGPAVVPILLYHSVCTEPARLVQRWSTTPARLREHLDFLAGEGYDTLTVTDYVRRLREPVVSLPERVALVTFDDGFADFTTDALPALVDTGTASTLYVSTAYVGATSSWLGPDGEQPMLSWAAIKDAAASGVEVGAHSHHHVALDVLPGREAEREIAGSKQQIEQHLGRSVTSFAYPHGYHGPRVRAIVQRCGFENACGVKHALSGPGDDEFGLARVMLEGDITVARLRAMLDELTRAPGREQVQTRLWRTYRRARSRLRPAPQPAASTGAP